MFITKRELSAILTRKEWDLISYSIKAERQIEQPRWMLTNVSGYGDDILIQIDVYGNFWKELDDIFCQFIPNWERMEAV